MKTNINTILVVSEVGRIRNRISVDITVIEKEAKGHALKFSFDFSKGSNKGLSHEAISFLVEKGVLDKECIDASGYISSLCYREMDFNFIVVEGKGLNYVSIATAPF
jgi:hypothetical protein